MAFENDPEGYRMAIAYAGRDFDKPRTVARQTFCEYDGEWRLDEFLAEINEAIAAIPLEYRDSARVELVDVGYHESSTKLVIQYVGPEDAKVVADRVYRCEEYVAQSRTSERATFKRLKAKFG